MYSRSRLLSIPVTINMVPGAKILVFYITPDGQVIADSLMFHVDATRNGKVGLNPTSILILDYAYEILLCSWI